MKAGYDLDLINVENLAAPAPTPQGKDTSKDYFDRWVAGLSLRVTSTGLRTWYYATRIKGAKFRTKIGQFDRKRCKYKDAAEIANQLRVEAERARNGATANPIEVRKAERAERKAAALTAKRRRTGEGLFGKLAERFIEEHAKPTKRRWQEDEDNIARYLTPLLGLEAEAIDRDVLEKLLDDIKKKPSERARQRGNKMTHTVNRVRTLISSIFKFGIEKRAVKHNSCSDLGKRENEPSRTRWLNRAEIRTVWPLLDTLASPYRDGYKLLLLTGLRRGEAFGLEWSEVDFESGRLQIAAERMKGTNASAHEHLVPLATQARAILGSRAAMGLDWLSNKSGFDPRFVFSIRRGRAATGADKAIEKVRNAAGLAKHFTIHDFRRTVETNMVIECGLARFIVERTIGHSDKDKVARTYDVHDYLPERTDALEKWDRKLSEIIQGVPSLRSVPEKRDAGKDHRVEEAKVAVAQ